MGPRLVPFAGLLTAGLMVGTSVTMEAQQASFTMPTWEASPSAILPGGSWSWASAAPVPAPDRPARSHTATGAVIGGVVGVAAAAVVLTQFCDDPDTACGVDEVGRAVALFTVPTALVGAVVGSLIRTAR